jgi:predicted PurR-regulated permease PerM
MPNTNQYQKIVPFIIFILALFLFYKLIQPMIVVLLGSILLAYITYPLYMKIMKKTSRKFFSIVVSLIIVALIILIPFSFLTFEITRQGFIFYNSLTENVAKGAIFGFSCDSTKSKLCSILNEGEKISVERLSQYGFEKQLKKFFPILEEKITLFLMSIPLILAEIFIALIITYFILKDWKSILKKISDLLPMRKKTINKLIEEFGKITHTVIYAQLFVALVQGTIATIGFYLFGVPFPLVLGVLVAFFALVPMIGTTIIWFPASLYLILTGYFSQNYNVLGKGIGLFFYGLLIISMIDNFLLPRLVNRKAKVNQIIVIVGVIGGVVMFGVIGIFIGPILLPLLLTYFETFKERLS